jgi:hypothetical protein
MLTTQFYRSMPGKPTDMNNFQRPPSSMQNNMAPGMPPQPRPPTSMQNNMVPGMTPQPRPPTMMTPPSSANQVILFCEEYCCIDRQTVNVYTILNVNGSKTGYGRFT